MGKVIIQERYTTKNPITMIGEEAGTCWGADTNDDVKNYKRGLDCLSNEHGRTIEYPDVYMILDGYSARVIREWYTHIGGSPTRLQASTRYIDYEHGDIPPMHYAQMMHYLLCTGFTGSYLSTLRDSDFYINHRKADEQFLEYLLSAEVDFWTHVIAKQPPKDDDSEKYNETLNAIKRMRIEEHKVMHADEKMDALIDQYNRTKDDLAYYKSMEKDTKKALDLTELEIRKCMIGFDEYEGRNKIILKPTTRRTLDRDRLNNDYPGLYEQYLKESTTTTMKVIEKEMY